MGISCTDEEAEKPGNPEAKPAAPAKDTPAKPETAGDPAPAPTPAPPPEPEPAPAKELGQVDAKANEKTAAVDFKFATALASNGYE